MNVYSIDLSNPARVADLPSYAENLSARECALLALQAARAVSDKLPEVARAFIAELDAQMAADVVTIEENERRYGRVVWPAISNGGSEADAVDCAHVACGAFATSGRSGSPTYEASVATDARRAANGAIRSVARVMRDAWCKTHGGDREDIERWAYVQLRAAVAHWSSKAA